MTEWPKILSHRTTHVSPWVEIIEREVAFSAGSAPTLYHAVGQADYLAIVARTPEGLIPIVRQYRPALERFTWELPAGLLDTGESPEQASVRELKEETGLAARTVHALGSYAPCTSRLSNWMHSFFVETEEPGKRSQPIEPGIEVRLVSPAELGSLIRSGEFVLQPHIGALLLAGLRGHIAVGEFGL